jgi:serine protease
MPRVLKSLLLGAVAMLALASPASAGPAYVPGEVVVHAAGAVGPRVVELPTGVGVGAAATALRRNPNVEYAVPNYIAHAAACPGDPFPACLPNDPGRGTGVEELQWNFFATPGGISALGAWQNLIAAGRPGGAGVKIAVLDSGIAYRSRGKRFKRSPDFVRGQFAPGRDFVDGDKLPLDLYGHGTHVAGTIGEQVNNGIGVTGLAYGATMIPVRVLDKRGNGTAASIARGIRFAASHGAQVINLSFDFPPSLSGRDLPEVRRAIVAANRRGALLVAAAGNRAREKMPWPAAGPKVVAVGASARSGCLAGYSNRGAGLDIVAPGGDAQDSACPAAAPERPPIVQMTLAPAHSPFTRFGLPGIYFGTSQATPHVSAIAAMAIASGVLGPEPSQKALLAHLQATGTPLPAPFGYVRLVNGANATAL